MNMYIKLLCKFILFEYFHQPSNNHSIYISVGMGVNMTMTLNPNGIGIPGRPPGITPGMAAIGGQPQPGMGIMAMMAAAAPPPPIGI